MRGEVANQPNQAPAVDVPEDPNFNWTLQKLPAETKFPVPCTGVVQRIAADLLARLPTMAARDQHDARFELAVMSDWPDLDDEIRIITFQRLNLYTIVAAYGWPTAFLHLLWCRRSQSTTSFLPGFSRCSNSRTSVKTTINVEDDGETNDTQRKLRHRPQHLHVEEVDAATSINHVFNHIFKFYQVP